MKYSIFFIFLLTTALNCTATIGGSGNLWVAPGTLTASTVTLLWDKPVHYSNIENYHIFLNGKALATVKKCNYTLKGLRPNTKYLLSIKASDLSGKLSIATTNLNITTPVAGVTVNILDFGAKGDGEKLNTKNIQAAINACKPGGTVLIPKGVFLSGALFLKSNMTLYIEYGAILKGSVNEADYRPFIRNRFEGWEMETYASLLNAGQMNNDGGYSVHNLAICGSGMISGGGEQLAAAMIAKAGMRSRGRLICLLNADKVAIYGLKIEESPSWTIHYIYSRNITCHDLDINSTVENGDGIDPDSSSDSYIFNCRFSTTDDCIAIKSGKNPEGNSIAKPTQNIRITDCDFVKGHGMSIGSEMSGGVRNILVSDCKAGNLLYGLQIKATKDRGGYIKEVYVRDCDLQKISVLTSLPYNNDGKPAATLPLFCDFEFSRINMTGAPANQALININGFEDPEHYTQNLLFEDILLPQGSLIKMNRCKDVKWVNVTTKTGSKPKYEESSCIRITH